MQCTRLICWVAGMVAVAAMAYAGTYSVPSDKVDPQKVYFGSVQQFGKPGSVDYQAVLRATPEFVELREKKLESGTAKYWILLSKASDHAARAIATVGQDTDYDLIVAAGYLESLEPPIASDDITKQVVATFGQ